MKSRAIFLDRDDTIIVDRVYLNDPDGIEFLPDVLPALRAFQDAGFLLVLVSNQSGIGRGRITESQYDAVLKRLKELLESEGVAFAGYYHCPHTPDDDCECRKPRPAMAFKAAGELDVDLSESYMVGDKDLDIEFGRNFGAKSCFRSVRECAAAIRLFPGAGAKGE